MKRIACLFVIILMSAAALALAGCGAGADERCEVTVFAASSMQPALEEIKAAYEEEHPDVKVTLNCDSSGVLRTQILEGAPCDIFFSAGESQMDEVEEAGLVEEGSRRDVLNNQLVVITRPGSGSKVTGIGDLDKAESLALAGGSVPVGKYTRRALMNIGLLEETEDPAAYTADEVSEALGGVEISEQGNVSKVLAAVQEGSCEVGTVYLSDTYGREGGVEILETVPYDIAGDIIYPAALTVNRDADEAERAAAEDVLGYLTGREAKEVYRKHLFDIVQ